MKILHIDSSLRQTDSISRELTAFLINQLTNKKKIVVDRLDLAKDVPSHMTQKFLDALFTPTPDRTPEHIQLLAESDSLTERMLESELIVIGVPMYNFSIPSHFKTFLDNIVVSGKTFISDENGNRGLLNKKKAVVINTRGGMYDSSETIQMDLVTPYLTAIFNFIGIRDIHFIKVGPTTYYGPEAKTQAIATARNQILQYIEALKVKVQQA